MAKENFFKRFVDSFRGGEEGSLNDRLDEPLENLEEAELEEAKPFIANPLAGVADIAESRFYTGGSGPRVDTAEAKHVDEHFRQEHEPYRFNNNGDMQVCISAANIYEINPKNASVKIHALHPLIIECPRNGVVYGHFETDNQGRIKNTLAGVYRLEVGGDLPDTTHFELPNEDDPEASSHSGYGSDGDYYIPICWIVDGKIEARQFDASKDGRQARLLGSVMGQRGPLIWNTGYNKLKNVGSGKNVYRNYIVGDDHKELRTIKDKGGSYDSNDNPYCGTARIRVHYGGEYQADGVTLNPNFDKANANEIVVRGNGYKAEWLVGGSRMGVVEDGLVNCLKSIPTKTLTKKTLQTASVLQAASGTQAQAASSDYSSHKQTAWTGGNSSTQAHTGYTPVSVLPEPTTGDKINVWKGGSTQDGYVGGSSSAVATSYDDRSDVWAQGSNSDVVTSTTTGSAYTGGSAAAIYTVDATSVKGWAGGSVGQVVTGSSAGQAWRGGTTAAAITSVGSGNAWTGGASASNNIVVSANDENDFVRGGVKTEAAGIPLVAIPIEFGSGGLATKWVWVMGYETQTAPTNNNGNAPTFPNFLTDGTNQTFTPFGNGVESVNLGQGIVGTNIASNAFHNSVATTASVPSGATLQNVITATTTGYGITRIDGDGHDSFTQPEFAVNPTAVTGVLKDLQAQTVLTSATTTANGIVGASQVTAVDEVNFSTGGVVGATQKKVIADSGSDTVGEIKVLKADTMSAISDVVSAPTTDPVVTGASLTTEFIKSTLPPVTVVGSCNTQQGGIIGATEKKIIADSGSDTVGEIKVLKADTMSAISDVVSAPTTDPVITGAALTTEFIKATLPAVNIPNVGSPVTVYKENTAWSADLLEPPSNTANIKVAVDPDGDSSVATCGDCGS